MKILPLIILLILAPLTLEFTGLAAAEEIPCDDFFCTNLIASADNPWEVYLRGYLFTYDDPGWTAYPHVAGPKGMDIRKSVVYKDELYVIKAGSYSYFLNVYRQAEGKWESIPFSSLFGNSEPYSLAVYNDKLYVGSISGGSYSYGHVAAYDGENWVEDWDKDDFGLSDSYSFGVYDLTPYKGKLYAMAKGVVYSFDGATWTRVIRAPGNGNIIIEATGQHCQAWGISSMAAYNDMLYVGTTGRTGEWNHARAHVWSFDGTSWVQIGDGGTDFGYTQAITDFVFYMGKLYAATKGNANLYSYEGSGNWKKVIGYYSIGNAYIIDSFAIYNNRLYMGVGRYAANTGHVFSYDTLNVVKVGDASDFKIGSSPGATLVHVYASGPGPEPPPVCGDGDVGVGEICDPGRDPAGGPYTQCNAGWPCNDVGTIDECTCPEPDTFKLEPCGAGEPCTDCTGVPEGLNDMEVVSSCPALDGTYEFAGFESDYYCEWVWYHKTNPDARMSVGYYDYGGGGWWQYDLEYNSAQYGWYPAFYGYGETYDGYSYGDILQCSRGQLGGDAGLWPCWPELAGCLYDDFAEAHWAEGEDQCAGGESLYVRDYGFFQRIQALGVQDGDAIKATPQGGEEGCFKLENMGPTGYGDDMVSGVSRRFTGGTEEENCDACCTEEEEEKCTNNVLEYCGDGIDNDGDGVVDEHVAGNYCCDRNQLVYAWVEDYHCDKGEWWCEPHEREVNGIFMKAVDFIDEDGKIGWGFRYLDNTFTFLDSCDGIIDAELTTAREVLTGQIFAGPDPGDGQFACGPDGLAVREESFVDLVGSNARVRFIVPDCGNGIVEPGEECDDGNGNDDDECTNSCKDNWDELFDKCICRPEWTWCVYLTLDKVREEYCGYVNDTSTMVHDPDPCAGRGSVDCEEDYVSLDHDDKTTDFIVHTGEKASFTVELTGLKKIPGGASPADIMYLLDKSGSMKKKASDNRTKIWVAKWALETVHEYLYNYTINNPGSKNFKVGLSSFNHEPQINAFLDYTDNAVFDYSSISACGCTGIGWGINHTINETFNNASLSCQGNEVKKVMVVASDGKENRRPWLWEIKNDIRDDITFYTIGINSTKNWTTKLLDVAQDWGTNEGIFYPIPSVDNLYDVYKEIADIYIEDNPANALTMTIILTNEFEYVDSTVQPAVVDGKRIVWNLGALDVGEKESIVVTVMPVGGSGETDVLSSESHVLVHNKCGAERLNFSDVKANVTPVQSGFCGDNLRQIPNGNGDVEDCDGTDDGECPGECTAQCGCPVPVPACAILSATTPINAGQQSTVGAIFAHLNPVNYEIKCPDDSAGAPTLKGPNDLELKCGPYGAAGNYMISNLVLIDAGSSRVDCVGLAMIAVQGGPGPGGPTVTVTGAPLQWVNVVTNAEVQCTDSTHGCDAPTYMLKAYAADPGGCPQVHDQYGLASPHAVDSYSWLCGAAKNNNGDEGFSNPVEFKVDMIPPVIAGITDDPDPLKPGMNIEFRATITDQPSGVKNAVVCPTTDPDCDHNSPGYDPATGKGRFCRMGRIGQDLWSCQHNTILMEPGTYNYRIMASDMAGNEAESDGTDTFTVEEDYCNDYLNEQSCIDDLECHWCSVDSTCRHNDVIFTCQADSECGAVDDYCVTDGWWDYGGDGSFGTAGKDCFHCVKCDDPEAVKWDQNPEWERQCATMTMEMLARVTIKIIQTGITTIGTFGI